MQASFIRVKYLNIKVCLLQKTFPQNLTSVQMVSLLQEELIILCAFTAEFLLKSGRRLTQLGKSTQNGVIIVFILLTRDLNAVSIITYISTFVCFVVFYGTLNLTLRIPS